MRCYVRLMRTDDILQVTEIDREAFPTLWPPANYQHELKNSLAHYVVACDEEKKVARPYIEATVPRRRSGLLSRVRGLFSYGRFSGNEPLPVSREYVIGFVGCWIMADEAHVTSIAVREIYRGQGIGELLLIALIDLATGLKARMINLEVRVSNIAAQKLYSKYGFIQVGLRRGYYTDDKEDGVLMTAENIASDEFQARLRQLKQSHSERWGKTIQQVAW